MPYQCVLQPNGLVYEFTTKNSVVYEAYFSDGARHFPGRSFAQDAIMFSLVPAEGSPHPIQLDARVMITATAIVAGRIDYDKESVVYWICELEDNRPHKRAQRFNRAFDQANTNNELIKVDIVQPPIYGAIIYHKDNPAGPEIEQTVLNLTVTTLLSKLE